MGNLSEYEIQYYRECTLCPRKCKADRTDGMHGFCKMGARPVVARAALHMWEEPCISGARGSGAVFFSGCNLQCVFCQNEPISRGLAGLEITSERLCDIFLELQQKGAHNINLVTGVMFLPTIVRALEEAKSKGLHIPIVYNCGGYESVEALKLLEGIVDIYLPDFKYFIEEHARVLSNAADYPEVAKVAIEEMFRQVGPVVFDDFGMMQKGVMVRHLVLPGYREESQKILQYLYDKYKDQIYFSIMNQYTPPAHELPKAGLNRRLTTYEYQKVIDYALDIGIRNSYMQEGKTASESFIPPFDETGVRAD